MPDSVKILVVDDSPGKLLAMRTILEELGEEIVTVASGEEALRHLLREDFAVILLDVNMPGMDGFETAALIRQRRNSAHTPIIFVTAFSEETHVQQGYSLGAVDYILTPVVPEVLRAKVAVFVDLYRKNEQVREQAEQRVSLAREQAARIAAEESNRAKSAFLANISHELRTPMNAIIGMTELALQETLSPVVRDYLQTVQSSADMLLGLLNEILDFSRLESGKFLLESSPFSLRQAVDETIKVLAVRAQEKGLEIHSEVAGDCPDKLLGDSLRLRQVLTNLVGNAVKFTQQGHVTLRLSVESVGPREVTLRFAVADTGIGISPADQQRIFAPFTQADSSTTRVYGGTGLGLAISSHLISLIGGRLWVESKVGRGSTFYFTGKFELDPQATHGVTASSPTLPASMTEAPRKDNHAVGAANVEPVASAAVPNGRSLRILLAEDTPANQKLIIAVLGKRGHSIEVAQNGREAVELLEQKPFDLVLMDVQMPVMDGLQATAAIRSLPSSAARVPIIAMTAHAMRGDEERCLSAGMDAYIAKPIDCRKLLSLIEGSVRQRQTSET